MEVKNYMKHFKLFVLAFVMLFAAGTYAQWTYCPGSIQITGLGTNPGVYCLDGNNAIVVGGVTGQPRVFKTTNGGANFINASGNLTGGELYAGCMIDANTFLVGDGPASGSANIKRTTDGGTTWTTVLTTGGSGGFFNGIVRASTNPSFIIAQSDAFAGTAVIFVSTNGGVNWTAQPQSGVGFTIGSLPAVWCIDNQFYGCGASTAPRIGYTLNGGSSWTGTALSVTGTFTSGAAFNDNKMNGLGISSASFPNISRTTNGPGGPWTTVSTGGTGTSTLNVLRWVPGTNICFLATSNTTNGIRMTTDNGFTWVGQTTGGITGFFDISVQNNSGTINGYCVAGDGSVVKLSSPVAIDPSNTTVPSSFALQQNYPNPFNPSTTIKYSVPVSGNVSIKVYNTLGVEVMTVVNKSHNAGNYVETVDLSAFSSGIYFYTLNANGFTETKKMMLVK
ncbi:MAG: Peptidase S8 and S53, subtilisin, kexin, sedolisin [Chlorobi bacterium OLB5]|nr:MAG: Peptidase S8 and S53, subtilisin, kexin, sedolisin [Chlorobi bacterium OLB5]